ncbi:DUF6328 family protein [Kitasatospora sp. NPDC059599]|uniref:DUF6328 family protein n=1 Tax=Kitasatospora sp. NPDC059599 TaxID=3346880 RepID=UPI00368BA68F
MTTPDTDPHGRTEPRRTGRRRADPRRTGRRESPDERADRPTAPVGYHRVFAGRRRKPQPVDSAARLVVGGLVLPALTIGSALLLLLRVATDDAASSGLIAGAVVLWFAFSWLLLPVLHLRRDDGHSGPPSAGTGSDRTARAPPARDPPR